MEVEVAANETVEALEAVEVGKLAEAVAAGRAVRTVCTRRLQLMVLKRR